MEVEVVLTFDDGPLGYHKYTRNLDGTYKKNGSDYFPLDSEGNEIGPKAFPPRTRSILDVLNERDAKAVFFVATHRKAGVHGGGSEEGVNLIKEMEESGHEVGIHYAGKGTHAIREHVVDEGRAPYPVGPNGEVDYGVELPLGAESRLDCDLIAGIRRLTNVIGCTPPTLVRPPGGSSNEAVRESYAQWGLEVYKPIMLEDDSVSDGVCWDGVVDTSGKSYVEALKDFISAGRKDKKKKVSVCILMHDQTTNGIGNPSPLEITLDTIEKTIADNKAKFGGYKLP